MRLLPALRLPGLAAFAIFASLLSCGREITGPGGGGFGAVSFDARFPEIRLAGSGEVLGIGAVVPFDRVRLVLRRSDGTIAIERLVDFPPGQETVTLSLQVPLAAGSPSVGETLAATLRFINAAGDTVFAAGPVEVVARPAGTSAPPPVPVVPIYVGVGADAASIVIAPDSFVGTISQQTTFTAIVRDSGGQPMAATPIAFTSTDSARVRVGLSTGVATLLGARGTALIIAQTLTGQLDTAVVSITPTASALVLVSGGAQQTLQGTPFPAPVRVRVNAADGVGVQGVTVAFAVTGGAGSVSAPTVVTDAAGEAQVTWTAGNVAGAGTLTVTVPATAISLIVGGQQLSAAPTSLAFSASPGNFTAGDTIPPFTVTVRDAAGGTVAGFSGLVSLGLSGGTTGATIVGVSQRNAVNGVASFSGLTVDRGGNGYQIAATVTGVPSVLTTAFNVAAAPPSTVTLLSGGNQTAPPSTALPDSIRVRVTDRFGFPQPGLSVQFAVAAGGGSVNPTTVTTNVDGRAATQWTLGAAGAQQVTATVGSLQPLGVNATVFTGGGTPTLFIGTEQVSATIGAVRTVPVFISPAAGASIVAQLVMRDTLVAAWAADSVIFPGGVSQRNPTLTGRGVGSTFGIVSSSAGTDSVLVTVDSVGLSIGTYSSNYPVVGDTLPRLILMSAPAGPGGVTVTVRSADPAAVLVSPGSGRSRPADPCDIYCYDLSVPPPEVAILAPPAESALVTIPEGQLAGYVVLFPVGTSANGAAVTATAPGIASASVVLYPTPAQLYYYPYWAALGATMPVGHREMISVETYYQMARGVDVRATSRNPAVVRVDSLLRIPPGSDYYYYSRRMYYEGLAPGSTWVVMEAPGFATDSFAISVVAPHLILSPSASATAVGSDFDLQVTSSIDSVTLNTGLFPARGSDLPVTAVSRDPSVLRIVRAGAIEAERYDALVRVRGVATGSTWVVTTAPGYAPDSAFVTVQGATLQVNEAFFRVGAGQLHESMYLQLSGGGYQSSTGQVATVVSSDTTILSVLTPQVPFTTNGSTPSVRLLGKAVGVATLTVTVPGIAPDVRNWTVNQPDLFLNTFGGGGNINADSATYTVATSMRDGVSVARPPADTVIAMLRSTNPSVLLVTDSIVRYLPGSFSSNTGRVRAVAPGTALLVISAPNFRPDTSGLITLLPRRLDFVVSSVAHGRALRLGQTLNRRSPNASVLPFTVTVQGPAGVTPVAPADSFPVGASSRTVNLSAGTGVGTDTVIVSAPGHAPDSLFVVVGTSRVLPQVDTYGLVGQQDDFVSVLMRPTSISSFRAASSNRVFAIESTDTTVVRVLVDTVRVLAGNSGATAGGYGSVRFVRPGQAYLRLVDPTGTFIADSVLVTVEFQRLYTYGGPPTIGIGTQTDPFERYVYRDYATADSLWVHLTSSAPTVITVPDSVLMLPFSSYAYYTVTAGDTVGSAIVTGTAPGYAELQELFIVTRPSLQAYLDETLGVGGFANLTAYLTDIGSGYTRTPLAPLPYRVRVDDPSILDPGADSVGTFDGVAYVDVTTLRGVGPGRSGFVVEDQRSAASIQSAFPARLNLDVRAPRLEVVNDRLSTGVGATTGAFQHYFQASDVGPAGWVHFSSVGGRVRVPGDSIFLEPSVSTYEYFGLEGLALGTDTLVISAAGYAPDTVIVDVARNLLRVISTLPGTIRMGDSVQVTLRLEGPDGSLQMQASGAPLGLTFTSSGGLQAVALTGGNLTTTSIPVGQSTLSFWLRATGPTGGSISVSGPSVMTLQLGATTRP